MRMIRGNGALFKSKSRVMQKMRRNTAVIIMKLEYCLLGKWKIYVSPGMGSTSILKIGSNLKQIIMEEAYILGLILCHGTLTFVLMIMMGIEFAILAG